MAAVLLFIWSLRMGALKPPLGVESDTVHYQNQYVCRPLTVSTRSCGYKNLEQMMVTVGNGMVYGPDSMVHWLELRGPVVDLKLYSSYHNHKDTQTKNRPQVIETAIEFWQGSTLNLGYISSRLL